MTPAVPAPAPLEATDVQRARALKAKIGDRVSDVRRHLLALRTAMAELAELRGRREETNARRDLDALRSAGVISAGLTRRLQRLRELRRMLVHEYATATAEQVHESALIVSGNFATFYYAYRAWIRRGFAPRA
jgi:hypothetical protein